MKLTPSSTARRRTFCALSRSLGSPQIPSPVMRIAPKPRRLMVRSPPTAKVPLAVAFTAVVVVILLSDAGRGVKVHGFALFEDFYLIFNVEPGRFCSEAFDGFIHGLAAEAEGSVVHRNHLLCAKLYEAADGLFGAGVHGAVSVREIGAYGKQGDLGMETVADLAEAVEVGGVAGVVDGLACGFNDVAAVTAVGVAEDARAPVAAGGHGYLQALHGDGFPPFETMDCGEAESFDQIFDAAWNDYLGRAPGKTTGGADDSPKGGEVEVIHVGVGEEDEVDGREPADRDSGVTLAA